jgi:hypothetical protein
LDGSAVVRVEVVLKDSIDPAYLAEFATVAENIEDRTERGTAIIGLLYDHRVVNWETNLAHNGASMPFDKEHFIALTGIVIPEMIEFFMTLVDKSRGISSQARRAEAEEEKN